jgi:hypothetical protein
VQGHFTRSMHRASSLSWQSASERARRTCDVAGQRSSHLAVHDDVLANTPVLVEREHEGWVHYLRISPAPALARTPV